MTTNNCAGMMTTNEYLQACRNGKLKFIDRQCTKNLSAMTFLEDMAKKEMFNNLLKRGH